MPAVGRMAADGSGSAGETGTGLAVRFTVFTLAVLIARRMRGGARWARVALGTASMVVQPPAYLTDGGSLAQTLSRAGALDLAFAGSRIVHVAAVLAAVALMFRPAAGTWFRRAG
ncbi:hypothetical protein [Streptomyces yangpuensis]|uniref:hypothetical protein n=1 Tax=Streptomyces yangpuensis TaxID=1648182 RepID=UPI0036BF9AD4